MQHIFQVEGNQVGKSYSFQGVCSYFAIIIDNITSTLQLDFLKGVKLFAKDLKIITRFI